MLQVERHIVNHSKSIFKQIDRLAYLSKNLYNACLYRIKTEFETTGKWIRYNDLYKAFYSEQNPDFFALPSATSQQILMLVDKNLKSYFALLKKYKNDKKSLNGCPKFPHYKHKTKGRNVIIMPNTQARLHDGFIKFPKKLGLPALPTNVKDKLNQVRIIPQSSCYAIEVIYDKPEIQAIEPNDNYLSIDLGLNNLMTTYDSEDNSSMIINGKPLKSMNQYYNKKKAKLQSNIEKKHKRKTSKKLRKLTFKRNNKVKDYLHKSSRLIVNYCLQRNISNIIIGYNPEWKQNIHLGKQTNQNFVQIPFQTLINQITYKAKLLGIEVQLTEESYTSKCSALDLEPLSKKEVYQGKRIKRGKYVSSNGTTINADLNGAINILRKVTEDKVFDESQVQTLIRRGQVAWPFKVNFE